MIDKSKETYQQYRERAGELYNTVAVVHGERFGTNELIEQVKVPDYANVQICEDGAFVDALVWVPLSRLRRPEQTHNDADADALGQLRETSCRKCGAQIFDQFHECPPPATGEMC